MSATKKNVLIDFKIGLYEIAATLNTIYSAVIIALFEIAFHFVWKALYLQSPCTIYANTKLSRVHCTSKLCIR